MKSHNEIIIPTHPRAVMLLPNLGALGSALKLPGAPTASALECLAELHQAVREHDAIVSALETRLSEFPRRAETAALWRRCAETRLALLRDATAVAHKVVPGLETEAASALAALRADPNPAPGMVEAYGRLCRALASLRAVPGRAAWLAKLTQAAVRTEADQAARLTPPSSPPPPPKPIPPAERRRSLRLKAV